MIQIYKENLREIAKLMHIAKLATSEDVNFLVDMFHEYSVELTKKN